MATLLQIQAFAAGNPLLKQRFQAARLQVAWNISADLNATAAQIAWANKIFSQYDSGDLEKEYLHFLSNADVQTSGASVTDAQIIAGITALLTKWV